MSLNQKASPSQHSHQDSIFGYQSNADNAALQPSIAPWIAEQICTPFWLAYIKMMPA